MSAAILAFPPVKMGVFTEATKPNMQGFTPFEVYANELRAQGKLKDERAMIAANKIVEQAKWAKLRLAEPALKVV